MSRWCRAGRGALLAALVLVSACDVPRDPIVVDEGMITVENMTSREWRSVRITVNDHFSGGAPSLLPGGRLSAPLSGFQTGFGQKFDRGRQSVFKVEVTATEPDGTAVKLPWGQDQRR